MLTPKKHIVCVSASYTSGQQLQVSLNKYAQEHDERFSYWEDFAFSTAILPECDSLLILNSPSETILTKCHPANVIAFMMEPGIMHEHPWMFRNLGQFSRVYSPVAGPHTICSHGYLGWYTDKSYPELVALEKPVKTSPASCIVSGLSRLPGHRERLKFSKLLMKSFPSIDFFGRDTCALGDKLDGLLPYKYSIAMENTSRPHYFTEKINDCFLAYTVPIYYGCTNIGAYFPGNSFIQIDISQPISALKTIAMVLEKDDWKSRLPAIEEARQLVLNRYQPLAGAAGLLRNGVSMNKQNIVIHPVRKKMTDRILARIKNNLSLPPIIRAQTSQIT